MAAGCASMLHQQSECSTSWSLLKDLAMLGNFQAKTIRSVDLQAPRNYHGPELASVGCGLCLTSGAALGQIIRNFGLQACVGHFP